MSDDKKNRGFEVKDRRVGALSEEEKAKEESSKAPATADRGKRAGEKHESRKPAQEAAPLPEITFPAFLLSLNTSALIHMGLIPVPGSEQVEKSLPLAKQTIDLLDLIKEKTKGNLAQEEQDLLDNLLFDLKMKYVELSKEE
jgi:hypothetical protein